MRSDRRNKEELHVEDVRGKLFTGNHRGVNLAGLSTRVRALEDENTSRTQELTSQKEELTSQKEKPYFIQDQDGLARRPREHSDDFA